MTRFRRSSRLASLLAGLATTVLASTAFAQGATITGTVKSAQGQALQAANIRIADLNLPDRTTRRRGDTRLAFHQHHERYACHDYAEERHEVDQRQ